MAHKLYKGYGRPVLVMTSQRHETVENSNHMILIPMDAFFGARTYFHDEDKMTNSCGAVEYDDYIERYEDGAIRPVAGPWKWYHNQFIQASDEELRKHLKSPKCSPTFRELAEEILANIEPEDGSGI